MRYSIEELLKKEKEINDLLNKILKKEKKDQD